MALLFLAHALVKHVRLSRWRWSLGRLVSGADYANGRDHAGSQAKARATSASVKRADWRLPLSTKCLARAVALQWRLRLAGVPSMLVIAFNRTDRRGDDAFHAWVECGGEIVIGQCDRAAYRPIMVFANGDRTSASGASSTR